MQNCLQELTAHKEYGNKCMFDYNNLEGLKGLNSKNETENPTLNVISIQAH